MTDQRPGRRRKAASPRTELPPAIHRLGDWMVNFYLVEDGAGITMVDSGLPGHYAQLAATLARLGRPVTDVRAVLITHGHPDHIGLAERIRTESGATVWVHPAEQPMLANPRQMSEHWKAERSLLPRVIRRPATAAVPLHIARRGGLRTPPVTQMTGFSPGQVLDAPGRPLAVAVPGHTNGSTAYVFPGHGVIFTGDALVTWDAITGRDGPRLVGRAFTQDSKAALASLGAMADHDIAMVLPGHGQPYPGGLADAIARARHAGIN